MYSLFYFPCNKCKLSCTRGSLASGFSNAATIPIGVIKVAFGELEKTFLAWWGRGQDMVIFITCAYIYKVPWLRRESKGRQSSLVDHGLGILDFLVRSKASLNLY